MIKELEIGEKVWRRLVLAGGFVWSHSDGTKTIHFNKGYKPAKELVDLVGRYRNELRMYVDDMHKNRGMPTRVPPCQGTFKAEKMNLLDDKGHGNLLTNEKGEKSHG